MAFSSKYLNNSQNDHAEQMRLCIVEEGGEKEYDDAFAVTVEQKISVENKIPLASTKKEIKVRFGKGKIFIAANSVNKTSDVEVDREDVVVEKNIKEDNYRNSPFALKESNGVNSNNKRRNFSSLVNNRHSNITESSVESNIDGTQCKKRFSFKDRFSLAEKEKALIFRDLLESENECSDVLGNSALKTEGRSVVAPAISPSPVLNENVCFNLDTNKNYVGDDKVDYKNNQLEIKKMFTNKPSSAIPRVAKLNAKNERLIVEISSMLGYSAEEIKEMRTRAKDFPQETYDELYAFYKSEVEPLRTLCVSDIEDAKNRNPNHRIFMFMRDGVQKLVGVAPGKNNYSAMELFDGQVARVVDESPFLQPSKQFVKEETEILQIDTVSASESDGAFVEKTSATATYKVL